MLTSPSIKRLNIQIKNTAPRLLQRIFGLRTKLKCDICNGESAPNINADLCARDAFSFRERVLLVHSKECIRKRLILSWIIAIIMCRVENARCARRWSQDWWMNAMCVCEIRASEYAADWNGYARRVLIGREPRFKIRIDLCDGLMARLLKLYNTECGFLATQCTNLKGCKHLIPIKR